MDAKGKNVVRDKAGKFLPGHAAASPGRPKRAVEDDFLAMVDQAVSADDWLAIIGKAAEQAKRGDSRAREWLTDRRFGKARERQEISSPPGEALELRFSGAIDRIYGNG